VNYNEDMNADLIMIELDKFAGGLEQIRLALNNLS